MLRRFLTYLGIVVIVLFIPLTVSSALRDGALTLVRPIGSFFVERSTGLRNALGNLGQIGSLRSDRENLQREVLELQQKLADQEDIRRENDALRQELGITSVVRTLPKVFAHLVVHGTDQLDPTYTIDAGSEQGVRVGQPAVYQGALVGRVIEVRNNSSVVRSITSRDSIVQVWLADTQEKGHLVGDGNTVFLKQITQGIEVPLKSIIETSGLGSGLSNPLPPDILVGEVGEATSAKSELSQTFRVTLPHDPNNLSSVFILLVEGL